jgi:hypothetical protein
MPPSCGTQGAYWTSADKIADKKPTERFQLFNEVPPSLAKTSTELTNIGQRCTAAAQSATCPTGRRRWCKSVAAFRHRRAGGPLLYTRPRGRITSICALRRQTSTRPPGGLLRGFAPPVDHGRGRCTLAFHWPLTERVLIEGIVNPVVGVVVHAIAHQPASKPRLRSGILPEEEWSRRSLRRPSVQPVRNPTPARHPLSDDDTA